MEAVIGGVGQVQWALAGRVGVGNGARHDGAFGRCCGFARRSPGLSVRCRGGRREELLKVRALSADGGGGGGNGVGSGHGGGGNGGGGGGGGGQSSGDVGPEDLSGILAWYISFLIFGVGEMVL